MSFKEPPTTSYTEDGEEDYPALRLLSDRGLVCLHGGELTMDITVLEALFL